MKKIPPKQPQNLPAGSAPALSPLPACLLPPLPAFGQERTQSRSSADLWFIKNYSREGEGKGVPKGEWGSAASALRAGTSHSPGEGSSPIEVNSSNGTKVGSGEGQPTLALRWVPTSPCSWGVTKGLRGPGGQLASATTVLRVPGRRGPKAGTDGQGERSHFQLLFCFPLSIPWGEPAPAPFPAPSWPPLQRLLPCTGAGSNAPIYDLLGDKRGLLAAVSNWCAGTTVAICLVGWWGGRGGARAEPGLGFCFSFHAPLNFAPFVSQRRAESWGEKRPLRCTGQGRARSAYRGVCIQFLLNIIVVIIVI